MINLTVKIEGNCVIAFGVCAKPNYQPIDTPQFCGANGGVFNSECHQKHYDMIGRVLASV